MQNLYIRPKKKKMLYCPLGAKTWVVRYLSFCITFFFFSFSEDKTHECRVALAKASSRAWRIRKPPKILLYRSSPVKKNP